jgi:hypothetical protein
MNQDEQIITQLGIADLPDQEQEAIINEAELRIGEKVSEQLNNEQLSEYDSIINNDEHVIDSWLDQNVPFYEQEPAYQAFLEGVDDDPEKNNPKKLFATVAWVQLTVPNFQEVVTEVLETYKLERAA